MQTRTVLAVKSCAEQRYKQVLDYDGNILKSALSAIAEQQKQNEGRSVHQNWLNAKGTGKGRLQTRRT